jgi:hypothetical protein
LALSLRFACALRSITRLQILHFATLPFILVFSEVRGWEQG